MFAVGAPPFDWFTLILLNNGKFNGAGAFLVETSQVCGLDWRVVVPRGNIHDQCLKTCNFPCWFWHVFNNVALVIEVVGQLGDIHEKVLTNEGGKNSYNSINT